jgi:excisionase family DNA binding protein
MEKHLTLSKAAEILGVTTQTLRNWDNAGKIKTIRTIGNQRRVPESEIKRILGDAYDKPQRSTLVVAAKEQVQTQPQEQKHDTDNTQLLMCKDIAVYDVTNSVVLNDGLLPGGILRKTLDFTEWMKTRYSSERNFSASRLMNRAFGADDYNKAARKTRALSLTDCYWLKRRDEDIKFNEVTPYFNKEWDGTSSYSGGSISTLFLGGSTDRRWLDAETLLKVNAHTEAEPYILCSSLGLENTVDAVLSDEGLLLTNFTSPDRFLETMEQSGFTETGEDPRERAVEKFKELAVALFVVDYLVEHNDRHWGKFGFLRDSNTGEYISMAPYYDFDQIWTGETVTLPDNAMQSYREYIRDLCYWTKSIASSFEFESILERRANELLALC